MLLARWGEFILWVLMPRAVPSADGFLPFQGVGGCAAEDWECACLGC
jgi:hypothetical protein